MTSTNEQTRRPSDQVASSARDPIDRWLDVFVRLLRVPRADARRIRDELEDHLRARVDDLMLTGQPEPEAVRTAVAELGETAELARQFQTASKPHRRLTMLTGSAIVSAGLIAGALLISQPSSPVKLDGSAGASAAVGGIESVRPDLDDVVFAADIVAREGEEFVRLDDAISLIEISVDRELIVHRAEITGLLKPGETAYLRVGGLSLRGVPLKTGLEQIGAAFYGNRTPLALQPLGDKLELARQSYFDERDAVLIEYDVSHLLDPPEGDDIEPIAFQNTVTSLIEPGVWMDPRRMTTQLESGDGPRARIGMVSTTMLVNAHPRIHAQVKDLFARIEARYDEQRRAQNQERRAELESRLAQHTNEIDGYNRRIAELEKELDRARQARRAVRERIYRLDLAADQADTSDQLIEVRLDLSEAEDELKATESHMGDVSRHLENMKSSLAITKGQVNAVEAQLASLADPTD